jgi:hypothetical protein
MPEEDNNSPGAAAGGHHLRSNEARQVNIAPQAAPPAQPPGSRAGQFRRRGARCTRCRRRQADENDGGAQDNRDDIANAMRELQALRAENERSRLA